MWMISVFGAVKKTDIAMNITFLYYDLLGGLNMPEIRICDQILSLRSLWPSKWRFTCHVHVPFHQSHLKQAILQDYDVNCVSY